MFDCLPSHGKEAQRRRWKQIGQSANQKRSYQDKSIDRPISRVQEEKTRFPSRPIRSIWQDDKADASSYEQVASAQPITSFGRIILRTNLRIDQSHPSDESSFGRTFVLTNQILRTDHPSDGISSRPITSFGQIILRTDFRIDQSHPLELWCS